MLPSCATMQNSFSKAIPTNDFICMCIFLLFSVIFYYLPVNTWRIIGPYAAMVTFIAFITIVAVCCSKAGGVGPWVSTTPFPLEVLARLKMILVLFHSLFDEPFTYFGLERKPSQSQVVWASFLAVSSLLGTHTTLNEASKLPTSHIVHHPLLSTKHFQLSYRFHSLFEKRNRSNTSTNSRTYNFEAPDHCIWDHSYVSGSESISRRKETTLGPLWNSTRFPTTGECRAWYQNSYVLWWTCNGYTTTRNQCFLVSLSVPFYLHYLQAWGSDSLLCALFLRNAYGNGLRYTLLFPRWFTIKRGGFLTLALAVAVNPWLFATEPVGFNLFLNGTAILWGCLTGIL